jgi:hypothetical protein
MCTAMLYDPKDHYEPEETQQDFTKHSKLYERFMRIKQWKLLAPFRNIMSLRIAMVRSTAITPARPAAALKMPSATAACSIRSLIFNIHLIFTR